MRKLFAVLALTLGFATASMAQATNGVIVPLKVTPISVSRSAADNSPALIIKYFAPQGTTTSTGTITVATAATDLRFVVNGAAYTGFEAPVSAPLGGIIDLTDASANTLGEVVDIINSTPITFSTGYFRAVIGAGLRSDVVSTLAFEADAADTDVVSSAGERIYWDDDVLDDDNLLLEPDASLSNAFFSQTNVPKNGPFSNTNFLVQFGRANITNGGTVGDYTIYAVKENYGSGAGCNSSTDCGSGSETVRTVAVLPAATATEIVTSTAFPLGFVTSGEKVFVRIDSSGADTTIWSMQLSGYSYPKQ